MSTEISLREKMVNVSHIFLTLGSPFQSISPKYQLYQVVTLSVFPLLGTENVHCTGHSMDWLDLSGPEHMRSLREIDRGPPTKASLFYPQRRYSPRAILGGQASIRLVPLIVVDSETGHPAEGISEIESLSLILFVLSFNVPLGCSSGHYCLSSPAAI